MPAPFTVTFHKRDFSSPLMTFAAGVSVERLEWRAAGGPWSARLRAEGSLLALWGLADLLRCGVTITDALGPAWWGYVAALEVHAGARVVRADLETMANKVAVTYRRFHPNEAAGERQITAAQTDADSARVYGEKARLFAIDQATPEEANAAASAQLARCRTPLVSGGTGLPRAGAEAYAIIQCAGWWRTLDWNFYADSRGLVQNPKAGAAQNLGDVSANTRAGQSFTVGSEGWSLTDIWVRARRVNQPTDNLNLYVCASSGGLPGTVISSAPAGWSSISDDWGPVLYRLPAPLALDANTTYWLQINRAGALNSASYYMVSFDSGATFNGGALYLYNGSAWVAKSPASDLGGFHLIGVDETTRQIERILKSTCGQFLSGVRMEVASGVYGRCYRDGSGRGMAEAEALMQRGSAGGGRLLARVEPDRTARVFAQPSADRVTAQIGESGALEHPGGQRLAASQCPAGQWAKLGGLASPGALPGYSGSLFIERCAWEEARGLYII